MAESNTAEKRNAQASDTVVDISGEKKVVKKKKPVKKKGGKKVVLILILFLMLLAIGLTFAVFRFDLFGIRAGFFEFAHNLDPEYRATAIREAQLDEQQTALDELQATLDERQDSLDTRQQQLDEAEKALKNAQENLKTEQIRTPIYRPPVNDEDVAYMKNIGSIYSSMDPENAADILARLYTIEDMAAILYYMPQSNAAAIMELMDHDIAAEITDRLLND